MKDNSRLLILITLKIAVSSVLLLPVQVSAEDELIELAPVVVTGSHLPISNDLPPRALTTINSAELELSGNQFLSESLRKLPFSFGASNTENDSNGGTGSAGANIHGLGNLSTLTLINGRRSGGNSALGFQHGGFADLNLIPTSAIREVQVATDGSSVAYGSDAVAGTVNILLHDAYIGNRIDSSYSNTSDGDASEKTFSFLTGQELNESTHLVLLGNWYQRNAIKARDREISQDSDRRNQGGQNQGSPTYPGRINVNGSEYVLKDGVTQPSSLADYRLWDSENDLYNFSDQAVAIPEAERTSLMANISHDISPNLQVWSELLYSYSEFQNGLAPAPWFGGSFPFAGLDVSVHPAILNAAKNSPHLPTGINPDELDQINYRSFEIGNLEFEQKKSALRGLLGLRGQLNTWNWETAALYIQTELEDHYSGIADENAVVDLINSGEFNPFATARSTGANYDNSAALQSVARNPINHYTEEFWSYDVKANAPILELPNGSVLFATGLEFRRETVDVDIAPLFESGDNLGGSDESSYAAERDVTSLFTETLIPVISNQWHELNVSLSARYENYSDQSNSSQSSSNQYDATVYKAALFYRPHKAIQIRAGYGTSFRAPTLNESYSEGISSAPIYYDPLGFTPNSSRIDTIISGNPDLDPEKSTNLNIGITFEPAANQGWQFSIDYYKIKTTDVIVNGAQYFIDEAAAGNEIGDAVVLRNPSTQALSGVFSNWFNASESITDGIDYKASFKALATDGFWKATLGVNQVLSYQLKASENSSYDSYVGKLIDPRATGGNVIGRGSIPEYKGYLELLWQRQALTLGGTLNYIHSLDDNTAFTTDNEARKVNAWITLDLLASYRWPTDTNNAWLNSTTLTLGIENVSNEAPPFAAGAFADGYDTSLYSLAGRRYRISLSREF